MTSNDDLERQKFEAWYLSHWRSAGKWAEDRTIEDVINLRDGNGGYSEWEYTNKCWLEWLARSKQEG